MHIYKFIWILFLANVMIPSFGQCQNTLPAWALGGFERPKGVNPGINPLGACRFADPMPH